MNMVNQIGELKYWEIKINYSLSTPEGISTAVFNASTDNGNIEVYNHSYERLLPLEITDITVTPNPNKASLWSTITITTSGYADNCKVELQGGEHNGTIVYPMNGNPITEDLNTWIIKYHTYDYELDGNISFKVLAYRGVKTELGNGTIIILGSYLEDQKATTKDNTN